jgi:endonuclease IV
MEDLALLKTAKKLRAAREEYARIKGNADRAHAHAKGLDIATDHACAAMIDAHAELLKVIDGKLKVEIEAVPRGEVVA